MFSTLVIALFVLALVGVAGLSSLMLGQSLDKARAARETVDQLEEALLALKANVRAPTPGAALAVPTSELSADGYSSLPAKVMVNAVTYEGRALVYCPYAPGEPIALATGVVTQPSGTTYPIETTANARTGNASYVTASSAPPVDGYLAILMAPLPSAATAPDCADVTMVDGVLRAPGAVVRGLTRERSLEHQIAEGVSRVDVFVAPAAAGSGSGAHPDEAMALGEALALWEAGDAAKTVLHLAAGTYALDGAALPGTAATTRHRTLVVKGVDRATTTVSAATPVSLTAHGYHLVLEDLALSNIDLVATSAEVSLENVDVGNVSASQSTLRLSGAVTTTGATRQDYPWIFDWSEVLLSGATVTVNAVNGHSGSVLLNNSGLRVAAGSTLIAYTPDLQPTIVLTGASRASVQSATVEGRVISGRANSLLYLDRLAELDTSGSVVLRARANPMYGLYVKGAAVLEDTALYTPSSADYGIYVESGGVLELEGSTAVAPSGAPPLTSIYRAP